MQPGEMGFLFFALGAISLFGGVLAWALFMEWRGKKKKRQQPETRAASAAQVDVGTVVQRPY